MAIADDPTAAWQRFVARRDADTRNALIEHHLPLARAIAAGLFARRGAMAVEFMDYAQLATVGLIEAIDRFEPQRGVPFEAYAATRIRGSVLNALGSLSETYRQHGVRQQLQADRFGSLWQDSAAGGDLFGGLADVAVGVALGYMLEGSGMVQPDEAQGVHEDQPFYRGVEQRQLAQSLARLVAALPQQERRVIRYHYYQGLAFQDIAVLFGVTKGRISQIHRQALQLIREARGSHGGLDLSL